MNIQQFTLPLINPLPPGLFAEKFGAQCFFPARTARARDFVRGLGGGFAALALDALLRLESAGFAERPAIVIDPINPFAPRSPHFAPKAKSVIFLFMVGGPSQVDTFDYKPELQKLQRPASARAYQGSAKEIAARECPSRDARTSCWAARMRSSSTARAACGYPELYPISPTSGRPLLHSLAPGRQQ
jgi:hypothetical protein